VTSAPFRAEVVGSLLRPPRLREAREAHATGVLGAAEFKRVEDAEIDRAIALQQDAGLPVVTDGEMRRGHFTGAVSETVDGLGDVPAAGHDWHGDDDMRYAHQRAVIGRLGRRRSLAQEEFVYARARASAAVKVTLPSPLMMQTFWSPEHSSSAHANPFEMFADAATVVREEIADLRALGCECVQIDAPEPATLVDPAVRESFAQRGIDPDRMLGEGIEILDSVAVTPGVRHALHLCRGNRDGHWMASGGYEAISKEVFVRATHFDTFLLEYDDERSGGFEPLADLPRDRVVVLGLVSTKRTELEDADALLRRIEDAARFYPRDQLAVSPQCGFESAIGNYPLDAEQQERKLRLVVDVAERAWAA
jgi:5-methyltetrahydropteroyltriglutamate--homocysteine methyltransferase